MTSVEIECVLPSEIKSPKGYIDIGSSFKNFHSCLEWNQFQDMEGKFVTKKSTDSTPIDIQKLQLSLEFRLGEPINKFNIGRIIPAMERYEPQRKYILPIVKGICNKRRFSSPGLSVDSSIRKKTASLVSNNEENSPSLSKGDDVASLKIGLKLSSSANARVSNDDFHPENASTPKNTCALQNVTSLETGLQLSSSENNRSFPVGRKSLQPRIAAGTLKGHHHNKFGEPAGISKEQDRNRLAASDRILKDHNQLFSSSTEISEEHPHNQLAESDGTSKEYFHNHLSTSHRILKGHIHNRISRGHIHNRISRGHIHNRISREQRHNQLAASGRILKGYHHNRLSAPAEISKEHHHNKLAASARISNEYHHNQFPTSSEISKERRHQLSASTGISKESKFTASAKISKEFHLNRLSASTGISKENKFTASAKISKEFHHNGLSASTEISKEHFNQLNASDKISKEHHRNRLSAPAEISKKRRMDLPEF